jgi:hypothetical protein
MNTKTNPLSMTSLVSASAFALALGLAAAPAHALIMLSPGDATDTTDTNSSLSTLAQINAAFGTSYTGLSLSYKANVEGGDEGPFAGFYTTTFDNEPDDPADALITWDGGSFIGPCPTCLLIVKDGDQTPAQYLFDLGNWDGQESIQLTGFWPNQGAISHIAIWSGTNGDNGGGDPGGSIPEPASLFLMGAGLIGFALARRRKSA